jgi:hypothetical protein
MLAVITELPRRVTWLSNVISAEKIGFEGVARTIEVTETPPAWTQNQAP